MSARRQTRRQFIAAAEFAKPQLQRSVKFCEVGTYPAFDFQDEILNSDLGRLLGNGLGGFEEAMPWKS